MKINTTEYHLFPVVDDREPEFIRAACGVVAITVTKAADFPDQIAISFLDIEHNPKASLSVDDFDLMVEGASEALDSLGYSNRHTGHGHIIREEEPSAS